MMFESTFRRLKDAHFNFPKFSDTRVMMMPLNLGSLDGVPDQYRTFVNKLYSMMEARFVGQVGYITIDEKTLQPGKTLRRAGLHVDGYYRGSAGGWGGGGGSWGSVGNGMITVSSTPHCRAYIGMIEGKPQDEGECDHLTMPNDGVLFDANQAYWVDGACVHESMPVVKETKRQFLRLSMPSCGPWFEGYTKNPTGIMPSHEILPRRNKFMSGN